MIDNYIWRPNDNSARTRLKYDLEAEHQVRAYAQARRKYHSKDGENIMYMFGQILVGAIQFIVLLFVGLFKLIGWMYNRNKNKSI